MLFFKLLTISVNRNGFAMKYSQDIYKRMYLIPHTAKLELRQHVSFNFIGGFNVFMLNEMCTPCFVQE